MSWQLLTEKDNTITFAFPTDGILTVTLKNRLLVIRKMF